MKKNLDISEKLIIGVGISAIIMSGIKIKDVVKNDTKQLNYQKSKSEKEFENETSKILVENFDGEWKEYNSVLEVIVNTTYGEQCMSLMVPVKSLDNKVIYSSITNPDISLVRFVDENGQIINNQLETGAFSSNMLKNQLYHSNEIVDVSSLKDVGILSYEDASSIETAFKKLHNLSDENSVLKRKK